MSTRRQAPPPLAVARPWHGLTDERHAAGLSPEIAIRVADVKQELQRTSRKAGDTGEQRTAEDRCDRYRSAAAEPQNPAHSGKTKVPVDQIQRDIVGREPGVAGVILHCLTSSGIAGWMSRVIKCQTQSPECRLPAP